MERLTFVLTEVHEAPVTKLGGQPVWLEAPSWPLSRKTGEPLAFVGQFRLPGPLRLAYLFMSSSSEVDTYEPEGGENAFFCQPGALPSFLSWAPLGIGPTHSADSYVVAREEVATSSSDDVWNRIGGTPRWLQNEEVPSGATQFVAQLDSCDLPFEIDFGDAGVGYAFISPSGEGRFLWQCC